MTNPPRHYFLNEGHELAHAEKDGGGGAPKFGTIDWAQRGRLLARSLTSARDSIQKLPDPTVADRLFMLAKPVQSIPKRSDNKTKHPTGSYDQQPAFSGEDSLAFRRLGIDLVDVGAAGDAVVHVPAQGLDRLLQTTSSLDREGLREQARWATMERFELVPIAMKVDAKWLGTFELKSTVADCVVRMHALLTRLEVEKVTRAIFEGVLGEGEQLVRVGRSFSGRPWFLAKLRRKSIEAIAHNFPSVQALHPPLLTQVDATARNRSSPRPPVGLPPLLPPTGPLPTVAVLDGGIPRGHAFLGPYLRGQYTGRNSGIAATTDHGSLVASRVVFGEVDFYDGIGNPPQGRTSILDVAVADLSRTSHEEVHVQDEDVVEVMGDVLKGNPEVRVFNLSFSGAPLYQFSPVERAERLMFAQDLDNFVFANDVIVAMSAGNSPTAAQPNTPYPRHLSDNRWSMGAWVTGVNTLKCGAYVGHPVAHGIVQNVGWPSPFTRIGPPVSDASAPEFSATGGDLGPNYRQANGAGVWCCDATGSWVDVAGTSFAAPLLAREAALAAETLSRVAGRPFAVLIRALMSITARVVGENSFNAQVAALAARTLGRGFPNASVVTKAVPERAFVLWQGILDGPGDIARVQLPLPQSWLSKAEKPCVRLVACWDPPVNHAVTQIWACRELTMKLKPSANGAAVTPAKNVTRGNSPVIERVYDLSASRLKAKNVKPADDSWVVELLYEEVAAYPIGVQVAPPQRVAFVAEIYDEAEHPALPHEEIQKLKASQSMTKLSALSLPVPATLLVTVK